MTDTATFDPDQELTLDINLDTFTLGEIAELERVSGVSFGQIGAALQGQAQDVPMGGILIGLALITLRRQYPKIKQAEVEKIKIVNVLRDGEKTEESEPTFPPPPALS